ncbi:MAG: DUF4398 domain-containing protein [Deltaproteobacteria bacterium]|nr:DUF4398 domain-containing protein [Deltaproteobacteria bacterium]MCB9785574.1 DUF4398 domain-containing protein [Deltaproteobacteria bacterium]
MAGLLGGALLASSLLGACGPVWATEAVSAASTALDDARRVRAHRLAPYEYWLAASYVDKAKRCEGYSEFDGAERFAREAKELAAKAADQAAQEERRQQLLQQRLKLRDSSTPPGGSK